MKKEIKTVIAIVIGAIFGYFIIQLISGDNSSTSFNFIGVIVGAVIAFVITNVVKNKIKKVKQENE